LPFARHQSKRLMKNIYLHLGMPKTGTTFLQARCFPYLKGVRYGDQQMMNLLDRVIYTNPTFLDLQKTKQQAEDLLENIVEESLLISHERLFGNMLMNYHDNLYLTNCLRALFPKAKIIIVIRRQDDLVESIYKQSLQSCYHQRINRFLNYRKNKFEDARDQPALPNLDVKQFNLHKYIQTYVEQFGRERIAVLPYELLKQEPGVFFDKLFAFLNVEPFYPEKNALENRSYSWLSSHLALLLNRFVRVDWDGSSLLQFIPDKPFSAYLQERPSGSRFYRILSGLNRRLSVRHLLQNGVDKVFYVKGNLISRKKRESILAFHRESNRALGEEFDLDLQSFGYY
jgi:hypothetical protein